MASSLVKGKTLPQSDLDKCVKACETIIQFNEDKQEMLTYVESRLKFKAPNLCEIVGKFLPTDSVRISTLLRVYLKISKFATI